MKKQTKILSLLLTLAMVAVPSSSFEHQEMLSTTPETPVVENEKNNDDTMSPNEQRSPKKQMDKNSKCNSSDDGNSILIPSPHSPIKTSRILTNLEQQEQVEDSIVPSKTTTCISIKKGNDGVIADMNISGICSCPDANHAMEAIFCRDTMDRTQLICKVSTKKQGAGSVKNDTPSCDTNLMLSIDNVDKEDAQLIFDNDARLETILMQSSHEFGKDKNSRCMDSSTEVETRSVKFHTKYIGFQSP